MKNTNGKPLKRFKKNILRLLGFYRKYEQAYLLNINKENGKLVIEHVYFNRLIWKN